MKSIKGYKKQKKFYDCLSYKKHVAKWKRNFYVIIMPFYATTYILVELFIENTTISFLSCLVVSSILFGFLGNKESKTRKDIIEKWMKETQE